MPHIVNGIGTWYYGKRNVHRLRNVCSQCETVGDLESYDTTLYFVFVMIPVVPLGSKRILDECPSCHRHRAMPLAEWNRVKTEHVTGVMEKLRDDPDNRATILEAISVAATFQDEPLYDKMSATLAADRTDDAEIQAALGETSSYFARHEEAAAAYMHSLRANDDPRVREKLGVTLLRLGRPEEAKGCFRHIPEEGDPGRLWMSYQLIVALQAKGLHADALEVLGQVEAAFPPTKTTKEWKALRKVSEKDAGRGRPVGKSLLREGKNAGTHEGSKLGARIPMLVLPLLLLAFAGWHTWRSLTLADAQPTFIVNGTGKAYAVTVNGVAYQLPPNGIQIINLPEGKTSFGPAAGSERLEPGEITIQSTFWARPYDRTRFVFNPDRLAVFEQESTTYSEQPPPNPPPTYFTGKPFYEFEGINHCFEPFPQSVSSKRGRSVTRTRLGLIEYTGAEARLAALRHAGVAPTEIVSYVGRYLAIDPDQSLLLMWYLASAPPDAAMALLKSRLGERPLRVDWHRMYQTTVERSGGNLSELQAEYAKLAGELHRDPDSLYLLSRVSDRDAAEKLLKEAIASGKPADYAHFSMGYRRLAEGKYADAVAEMELAPTISRKVGIDQSVEDALLGAKRYAELLKRLDQNGPNLGNLLEKARVCEISGDRAGADTAQAAALAKVAAVDDPTIRTTVETAFRAARASARGDVEGFLAASATLAAGEPTTALALLKGDRDGAIVAAAAGSTPDAAVERGLILLATPANDPTFPASKIAFLTALGTGDRDARDLKALLERGGSDGLAALKKLVISPRENRVYVAAASAWFPKEKAQILEYARLLDFRKDEVSLVLARYAK